ncbi:MAG: efflux RND transporter permease subunit [Planctomycetota bacterium]
MTRESLLDRLVRFCLEQKLVVFALVAAGVLGGVLVAPFDWDELDLPRSPIAVDALPDLGENQQIVFTRWPGRSPQDVEDQVTYPLTVALLGVPGVRTVRSSSMFGFSSIYVIFEEDAEFYWSRTRVLERLASLAPGTLPADVRPTLGPDATPLGQIFWYTLEGLGPDGEPTGGWDLHELRTTQDWIVRYGLASAEGISEVASVGGYVREYQVDVDPDAMRAHGVTLGEVVDAVRRSNLDVGARTVEVNRVEYVVRGLGLLSSVEDLERSVVRVADNVPILVGHVAEVGLGPALRRGALDKGGAEAVGGVVVARYGYNPLQAVENVKREIERLAPGLPAKAVFDHAAATEAEIEAYAREHGILPPLGDAGEADDAEAWLTWLRRTPPTAWPEWVTLSRVSLVPFYDRTELIHETLDTLSSALFDEILVTVLVVLLMTMRMRASLLVAGLLPLAVLACFLLMKLFGVTANLVALAGIAIAVGTMVDMGIVLAENVLRRMDAAAPEESSFEVVRGAISEVAGAVVTAVATTVLGFLPVFFMTGAEGKLFRPLAFTKTFALVASIVLALTVLPPAAHVLFARGRGRPRGVARALGVAVNLLAAAAVLVLLARHWRPRGAGAGELSNLALTAVLVLVPLLAFWLGQRAYPRTLAWALQHKALALLGPAALLVLGLSAWLGWDATFGTAPRALDAVGVGGDRLERSVLWRDGREAFPGLGREFLANLDEGSFLLMPITMPHASIGEVLDVVRLQDLAISAIPEVSAVVAKLGRADSALDPAPVGMIETVIQYVPEYAPGDDGRPVRQWRDHIRSPDDIWDEIARAAEVPGTTTAPKLQPIAARLVMLQSGMRAPMGVKVLGPSLDAIERVGLAVERLLKDVPGVQPAAVVADRVVGKPYLEIDLDREAIARFGLHVAAVQEVIEIAIGGKPLTTTVEGRERYPVRVRYQRELRDDLESIERILVPTPDGAQIPLTQLAELRFVRGPQAIRSEDTQHVSYVIFDRLPGWSEVEVVERCRDALDEAVRSGELQLPPGVRTVFAGSYENQVRAQRTLRLVLPLALLAIFLVLYLQFRSVATTCIVWSGVLVAWAGGFLLLWLYGRPWFLDFELFGGSLREVFDVGPQHLSVAVWVGFLALFGIATDDGVVMGTYLGQSFAERAPATIDEIRAATVAAGRRRVRACLTTTATTLLALLPVLSSSGRGSDLLVPMAIPTVGGMAIALLSMLVVPVLFCAVQELRLRWRGSRASIKAS